MAKTQLILQYKATACKLARAWIRRKSVTMDMKTSNSVAYLALVEAAATFEPKRGTKFDTYLYLIIHRFMCKELAFFKANTYDQHGNIFIKAYHDKPRKISLYDVEQLYKRLEAFTDSPRDHQEMKNFLGQRVNSLPELEKEIIKAILQDKPMSEVAKDFNINRVTIFRRRKALFQNLREALVKNFGGYEKLFSN